MFWTSTGSQICGWFFHSHSRIWHHSAFSFSIRSWCHFSVCLACNKKVGYRTWAISELPTPFLNLLQMIDIHHCTGYCRSPGIKSIYLGDYRGLYRMNQTSQSVSLISHAQRQLLPGTGKNHLHSLMNFCTFHTVTAQAMGERTRFDLRDNSRDVM